jgi:hypothetical protein
MGSSTNIQWCNSQYRVRGFEKLSTGFLEFTVKEQFGKSTKK